MECVYLLTVLQTCSVGYLLSNNKKFNITVYNTKWGAVVLRSFEAWAIPFTPICLCLLEETVKTVGPFYMVHRPWEVKDPTQGNEKSCDGLTKSREGPSYINPQRNILVGRC